MLDFVIAALPWLGLGVCLSIIIAKVSKKRKNKKENNVKLLNITDEQTEKQTEKEEGSDYMAMGMSLGMCFGVMLSTLGLI